MYNFPLVHVILLNFNSYTDTIECVESLKKVTYPNLEIIIVDNFSSDMSENILRQKYPDLVIIQTGKNLGFAGGNNIGIKYSLENGADYVCLLNNDTTVEPNFLSFLVETAESDRNIGIVGGVIKYYNQHEKIWYSGGYFSELKTKGIHLTELPSNDLMEVSFITGCLQLIRKEVIIDIGYLPEEYFIYYEDVDFCKTVKDKGYKLLISKNAVIYHKCGSTASYKSPISIYYSNRNKFIFINKHYKGLKRGFLLTKNLFLLFIKGLLYRGEKRKAIISASKFCFPRTLQILVNR
ncbi:hypothetical protein B4100_0937 [Heyndrickxia coagulans]|nr:hypothetical protein B4100_0937 [Heyndrickxia coagulans]